VIQLRERNVSVMHTHIVNIRALLRKCRVLSERLSVWCSCSSARRVDPNQALMWLCYACIHMFVLSGVCMWLCCACIKMFVLSGVCMWLCCACIHMFVLSGVCRVDLITDVSNFHLRIPATCCSIFAYPL